MSFFKKNNKANNNNVRPKSDISNLNNLNKNNNLKEAKLNTSNSENISKDFNKNNNSEEVKLNTTNLDNLKEKEIKLNIANSKNIPQNLNKSNNLKTEGKFEGFKEFIAERNIDLPIVHLDVGLNDTNFKNINKYNNSKEVKLNADPANFFEIFNENYSSKETQLNINNPKDLNISKSKDLNINIPKDLNINSSKDLNKNNNLEEIKLNTSDPKNLNENNNLKETENVAFYRRKPFMFGSIGLALIAMLATSAVVPLSLQISFSHTLTVPDTPAPEVPGPEVPNPEPPEPPTPEPPEPPEPPTPEPPKPPEPPEPPEPEIPPLKPSGPTDFVTKLQIVNNLSNNEKINLWNSYVNTTEAMINWANKSDQPKILNFLKNNFDSSNNFVHVNITHENGSVSGQNITNTFKIIMDILIANDNYYYPNASPDTYNNLFSRTPADESFFSLTSKGSNFLRMSSSFQPNISVGLMSSGIPDVMSPEIGVSKENVSFTFTLDSMSIKFPYNESYISHDRFSSSNQMPFLFVLKNDFFINAGYYVKPINNTLTISNTNALFSGFTKWMEDYLTNNFN